MSKMSEEFKSLLISKLKELDLSDINITKCITVLAGYISELGDRDIVLATEHIVRCLHKNEQVFEGVNSSYLFSHLEDMCYKRGIRYTRTSLGNSKMTVTDHKFVQADRLIHDFAVVDR